VTITHRTVGTRTSDGLYETESPDPTSLTARELQVLSLLAQGKTTDQIAHDLKVSRVTVRNYIQRIHQKLGVHQRIQAVVYAFQHGLVNGPVNS